MPLTEDEFVEAVNGTCKHCAAGSPVRYRTETKEYVHDWVGERGAARTMSHAFCLATGLRKFYEGSQK
jgi:hypothetical protein